MIGADGGVGQLCRGEHTADARLDDRKNSIAPGRPGPIGCPAKACPRPQVALIALLISSHGELVEIG